jgi:hypothetical protein
MQIHLHEVKILQIHNARPEFVKKIWRLLTNQNPAFLYIYEKGKEDEGKGHGFAPIETGLTGAGKVA